MGLHVLTLAVELRLPDCRSLKAKRSVVKSITETSKRRWSVAASETDDQDIWDRAELGFAAVSSSAGHCTEIIDRVERFVWSVPEAEVLTASRHWLEVDR